MNLRQVIVDAIQLADEHAPTRGELLENFHDRRAAYVLKAIEDATGVGLDDLEKMAERETTSLSL